MVFQYDIISFTLKVESHSRIFLIPSFLLKLTTWFLQCLFSLLFRVRNINSIGAHSGAYGAKNMTIHPILFSISKVLLDLWIGQLSRINITGWIATPFSFVIQSFSLYKYSIKVCELLFSVKFETNQFPREDIEPCSHILFLDQLIPLSSHE